MRESARRRMGLALETAVVTAVFGVHSTFEGGDKTPAEMRQRFR